MAWFRDGPIPLSRNCAGNSFIFCRHKTRAVPFCFWSGRRTIGILLENGGEWHKLHPRSSPCRRNQILFQFRKRGNLPMPGVELSRSEQHGLESEQMRHVQIRHTIVDEDTFVCRSTQSRQQHIINAGIGLAYSDIAADDESCKVRCKFISFTQLLGPLRHIVGKAPQGVHVHQRCLQEFPKSRR